MKQRPGSSYLLALRVWQEDMGDGRKEWRGRLQNVTTNEVRYFYDWATLLSAIQEMLAGPPDR